VLDDYYDSGFDGEAEMLMLVHGQVAASDAVTFVERLQRVGQDFAQQHIADQKLDPGQKRSFTMVLAMRNWFFSAFEEMKRLPQD